MTDTTTPAGRGNQSSNGYATDMERPEEDPPPDPDAVPPPPSLPDVESPPPDEVLEGVPSADELIERVPSPDEITEGR